MFYNLCFGTKTKNVFGFWFCLHATDPIPMSVVLLFEEARELESVTIVSHIEKGKYLSYAYHIS